MYPAQFSWCGIPNMIFMYVCIIYIFIFGDKELHAALFPLRKVQQNSFDTALF